MVRGQAHSKERLKPVYKMGFTANCFAICESVPFHENGMQGKVEPTSLVADLSR